MRPPSVRIVLFASVAACSSGKAVQRNYDGSARQTGGAQTGGAGGAGSPRSTGDGNGGSGGGIGSGGILGSAGTVGTGGILGTGGGRDVILDAASDFSADAAQDLPGISSDGSSLLDASLACPEHDPWSPSTPAICPKELAWANLLCTYSVVPSGMTGDPCTVSLECRCISGQGGPMTCMWSEVSEVCPDAGVSAIDTGKPSPDVETPVSCGGSICGEGQYCRADCCATRGCVQGPPSCQPLPSACNGTPTCECICGRPYSLCTISSGVAVQCGCA